MRHKLMLLQKQSRKDSSGFQTLTSGFWPAFSSVLTAGHRVSANSLTTVPFRASTEDLRRPRG